MATGMKRVAFTQADNGHDCAFKNTVFPDCLFGVTGTGRMKTATWPYKGADQVRIQTNQSDEDALHLLTCCQCFSSER